MQVPAVAFMYVHVTVNCSSGRLIFPHFFSDCFSQYYYLHNSLPQIVLHCFEIIHPFMPMRWRWFWYMYASILGFLCSIVGGKLWIWMYPWNLDVSMSNLHEFCFRIHMNCSTQSIRCAIHPCNNSCSCHLPFLLSMILIVLSHQEFCQNMIYRLRQVSGFSLYSSN